MKDPTESETPTDDHKTEIVQRILLGELTAVQACEQEGLTTEELTEWVRVYRRATRRAVDDQLAAALSAQGLEVDDFVLSGNLESMAVAELIQTIQYGRKDAHIRIEHDGAHSHIWCMDGDVIDARTAKLVGAPAVYRLLSLGHGRLQADFSKVLRTRIIEASTQALMLESAKRFDECRALRERIGDMKTIYVQSLTAIAGEALLEPAQRDVMRAFDGNRDVETVVRDSALPDLETLATVVRLLAESWIAVKPAASAEATLPSPAHAPVSSRRSFQVSVLPFAASLRAHLSEPVNTRRWVWAGLLAGAAALPLAFAIGFWSARHQTADSAVAGTGEHLRAAVVGLAPALCGAEMALIQPPPSTDAPEGESQVSLEPYCLAAHEVTTSEYAACVAAGKCQPAQTDFDSASAPSPSPEPSSDPLAHCNTGRPGHELHAINCVTFRQAEEYCAWRGGRLPTESEWEFAAKASASAESALIANLLNGVSEWTSGRLAARNPSTPHDTSSDLYVVLGGGLAQAGSARSARPTRLYMNASTQGRSVGFRCALGVETTAAARGAPGIFRVPARD